MGPWGWPHGPHGPSGPMGPLGSWAQWSGSWPHGMGPWGSWAQCSGSGPLDSCLNAMGPLGLMGAGPWGPGPLLWWAYLSKITSWNTNTMSRVSEGCQMLLLHSITFFVQLMSHCHMHPLYAVLQCTVASHVLLLVCAFVKCDVDSDAATRECHISCARLGNSLFDQSTCSAMLH